MHCQIDPTSPKEHPSIRESIVSTFLSALQILQSKCTSSAHVLSNNVAVLSHNHQLQEKSYAILSGMPTHHHFEICLCLNEQKISLLHYHEIENLHNSVLIAWPSIHQFQPKYCKACIIFLQHQNTLCHSHTQLC